MASGCIMGDCYICGEWVYEDNGDLHRNDKWKHYTCKTLPTLKQENEMLRQELEDYKKWLKGRN